MIDYLTPGSSAAHIVADIAITITVVVVLVTKSLCLFEDPRWISYCFYNLAIGLLDALKDTVGIIHRRCPVSSEVGLNYRH